MPAQNDGIPLGIIALGGALPPALAAWLREQGRSFFCVSFEGITDPAIKAYPHGSTRFLKARHMISLLRESGCRSVVLVGQVFRPRLFSLRFDLKTLRYLPIILAARGGGDDAVMRRVTAAFEQEGFNVVSLRDIAPALIAPSGYFGKCTLPDSVKKNLSQDLKIVRGLGSLDIGQAAVIDKGRVIAVEAAEGTNAMLRRVKDLRGTSRYPEPERSGILLKTAKPQQQLRNDMPVIGFTTVAAAIEAGLCGIVVEAGRVVCADLPDMVAAADRGGLALLGVASESFFGG